VISTYVLVAVLKKHLQTELSLYTMLQILSVSSFQKIELSQVLSAAMSQKPEESTCNQLQFFDLQPDTSGLTQSQQGQPSRGFSLTLLTRVRPIRCDARSYAMRARPRRRAPRPGRGAAGPRGPARGP
jgi:hypothetical protein